MAAIGYVHTAVTTNQNETGATYVDVPGAEITAAQLSAAGLGAGDKVLILVQAHASEDSAGLALLRVIHGATAFSESEMSLSMSSSTWRCTYWWGTVWTVVASEDITLQFRMNAGGSSGANVNFVSMFALNLSDDLTENTDWFFAESATDENLSTSADDGASITFTPATAGHDWLVMSFAQYDVTDTTNNIKTSLIRSGEASSSLPSVQITSSTALAKPILPLARVFTGLGAVSQTFKEQSVSSGTAHTRFHSAIFALDLNAFAAHTSAYTEGTEALQSASDYADPLQTTSITPTITGPVYVGGWWNFDSNLTTNQAEFRLQIDNSDDPAGQTTANYQFYHCGQTGANTDESPLGIQTVTSLSNAAHTLDLDGSVDATGSTPVGKYRSLFAFALELPAQAGAGAAASGIYRIRRTSWG